MALRTNKKVVEEKTIGLDKLKPDMSLPSHYLSSTQISMYSRCPKQYEFRYVDQIKLPPAVALVEGSCHHDALFINNMNYYKNKKNLPKEMVIENFCDNFSDKSKEIDKKEWKESGEDIDSVVDRGKSLLTTYMDETSKVIKPTKEPERKIEIELGGVPILGFIDVEVGNKVVDYKVVKRVKSQNDVDTDLQLSIYSAATGCDEVGFCCLVKTNGKVRMIDGVRSDQDIKASDMYVSSVAKAIKAGIFPMCSPSNTFPCSRKWCGYWNMCRGKAIKW